MITPDDLPAVLCQECDEEMELHSLFNFSPVFWVCVNPDCEEHDPRWVRKECEDD